MAERRENITDKLTNQAQGFPDDTKKAEPHGIRFFGRFVARLAPPDGSIVGQVNGFGGNRADAETPADLVALGSGAELALLALGRRFEGAAAAHFLEDALAVEFGFEAFEGAVNRLPFFYVHSTHADIFRWLYSWKIVWGAVYGLVGVFRQA
jgi:hypothetical protein